MKRFVATVTVTLPEDLEWDYNSPITVEELVRIAERGLQDRLCDCRVKLSVVRTPEPEL